MNGTRASAIVAIAAALCVITGCKGEQAPTAAEPSAKAAEQCPPSTSGQKPDEKYLAAEFAKMPLPLGICFFTVSTGASSDHGGRQWITVAFRMPAPTNPDDLRPVATDVAHLLKKTEIGKRTAVLDVNNLGGLVAGKERVLVTDENFADHPWDGTPSREAEMAIWVPKPPD